MSRLSQKRLGIKECGDPSKRMSMCEAFQMEAIQGAEINSGELENRVQDNEWDSRSQTIKGLVS